MLVPPPPSGRSPLSRFSRRAALLAVIGGGLIYYSGDRRQPVTAAVGNALSGDVRSAPAGGRTIRLATFNIHGGAGSDRRLNLGRTADALSGFDLIVLNEVHGSYFWQATGQAERLARLTDKRWLFAPTEQRWWHHQFGNAALSSLTIAQWQRIPLPSRGRGYRNLMLIALPLANRTLHVVGTHLDRNDPDDRQEQLQAAIGLFLALAEPAVLLGDLNTTADDAVLARLLSREGVCDPLRDALADATPRRIDWIVARGLRTIDAGIVDNGASDHPLLWAEMELAAENSLARR